MLRTPKYKIGDVVYLRGPVGHEGQKDAVCFVVENWKPEGVSWSYQLKDKIGELYHHGEYVEEKDLTDGKSMEVSLMKSRIEK